MTNTLLIATELKLKESQVQLVIDMLAEGATIPFMARYRKELTGSLDEVELTAIRDRHEQLMELDKRRDAILKSIEKQEKLTPALTKAINEAQTLAELEDIYLPYKPKRKTRASIAREKGLEPLALRLFEQEKMDVEQTASAFINTELGVATLQEALEGARDIIAEWVSENPEARKAIRELFWNEGVIQASVIKSKAENEEAQKFKDYFDWKEPIKKTPSHRLLAMRRAEKEGFISLDIAPTEELAIQRLAKQFVKTKTPSAEQVSLAIGDSYKRLLKPSLESEVRAETKLLADLEAICDPPSVRAGDARTTLLAELADAAGWAGERGFVHELLARTLSGDLAALTPDAPVLTRMENLRRATIYAMRDPVVAEQLLKALMARALSTTNDGRAWFDAGYLIEAYRQGDHLRADAVLVSKLHSLPNVVVHTQAQTTEITPDCHDRRTSTRSTLPSRA